MCLFKRSKDQISFGSKLGQLSHFNQGSSLQKYKILYNIFKIMICKSVYGPKGCCIIL